jgi:PAS domain S-box-containing protein
MKDAGKTGEQTLEQMQELYRTLLRALPLGVIVADLEGKIIDVSEQTLKDLGADSLEQVVGRSSFEFIAPGTVEQAKKFVERTVAEGVVESVEFVNRRLDGTEYESELNLALVRNREGKPVAFVGVGEDVTERRKTEKALRESVMRFREMADLLPTVICEIDLDMKITYVNQFGFDLMGYTPEDMKAGIFVLDLVHPDDTQKTIANSAKVLKGETIGPVERRMLKKDGSELTMLLNSAPMWREGEIVGIRTSAADITQLKEIEGELREYSEKLEKLIEERTEALGESERIKRTLLDNLPEIVLMLDMAGRILYINRSAILPLEQVQGQNINSFTPPEFVDMYNAIVERFRSGEDSVVTEVEYGSSTFRCNVAPIRKNGEVESIVAIASDITELKKTREEVTRLSQFLEVSIDNANVWFDVLDEKANVLVWNKAAEMISGYTKEEVVGHGKIWEWLYPDEEYRNKITEKAAAIIRGEEEVKDFVTAIRTKSGEKKYISWHSRNLLDEAGKIIGSVALGRDVTNQKLFTEKLEEAREEERKRLSGELHDNIGQMLTLARIRLDRLRDAKLTDSGIITSEISEVSTLLSDILDKTRNLSQKLRPPLLDQLGLVPAITALARRFERDTGAKIHVSTPEESSLQGDVDMLVYRILQESLTNVARHAKATEVHLDFAVNDKSLDIEVSDNGSGFDMESLSARTDCIGIKSMKWVVEERGGDLRIMSEPEAGTTIKVSVPLSEPKN